MITVNTNVLDKEGFEEILDIKMSIRRELYKFSTEIVGFSTSGKDVFDIIDHIDVDSLFASIFIIKNLQTLRNRLSCTLKDYNLSSLYRIYADSDPKHIVDSFNVSIEAGHECEIIMKSDDDDNIYERIDSGYSDFKLTATTEKYIRNKLKADIADTFIAEYICDKIINWNKKEK